MYKFLISLSLCLILFASCEEQVPSTEQNYEDIKQILAQDDTYQEYTEVSKTFYSAIRNGEIALFSIHNETKDMPFDELCISQDKNLMEYKGFEKYQSGLCSIIALSSQIKKLYPGINSLTDEEKHSLFLVDINNSGDVLLRGSDCLDSFQSTMSFALQLDGGYWEDMWIDIAIYEYEKCCENGGSGCP